VLEGSVTTLLIELNDCDESHRFEHDLPKPPSIIGANNIAVLIRWVKRPLVLIGVSVGRVRMSFLGDEKS
jgi:hypothetical protein